MQYHAHVYWQNEAQRYTALMLRPELAKLGCDLGTIWDRAIGPHPLPMYQVNYNSLIANEVESMLANSRLDVLLHEDTGDDVRDHTHGARWLGNALALDIEWLRLYAEGKIQ